MMTLRALIRTSFLLLVIGNLPVDSFAELIWDTHKIDLKARNSDRQVVTNFHFHNGGSSSVTITDIHTSCGCTTADLDKRVYAPGEGGDIRTVYTVGSAAGPQQKTITVVTNESDAKPVDLELWVNVLEEVTYTPRMLLWRIGDQVAEKPVVVSTEGGRKLSSVEVKNFIPKANALVRLEAIPNENKFKLYVRPTTSLKTGQTSIACLAHFADGTAQAFTVVALVR